MRLRNALYETRKTMTQKERDQRAEMMRRCPPTSHGRLWLTREQAAEALRISSRSVDRYKANGELGYYRGPVPGFDAALRFWAADVDRLVAKQNRED